MPGTPSTHKFPRHRDFLDIEDWRNQVSVQNPEKLQQSTKEQAANRTSEDGSFALSRRNVMKTGATVVAATAVGYTTPLVRTARANAGLSAAPPFFSNPTALGGANVNLVGGSLGKSVQRRFRCMLCRVEPD